MKVSERIVRLAEGVGAEAGVIPFSALRIVPGLSKKPLPAFSSGECTAVVLSVPYRPRCAAETGEKSNISLYAVPRDYHLFFADFFSGAKKEADAAGVGFAAFADASPIDEVSAAVSAGLGVRGKNRLFLSDRFGSFVFLGVILLSEAPDQTDPAPDRECEGCGKCLAACPTGVLRGEEGAECLSAVTQKKGELTAAQRELIRKSGCAWGCDVCQKVCPRNRRAERSQTAFFADRRLPVLSAELIDAMPDEVFAGRAYSWRKKQTIRRNLEILHNDKNDNESDDERKEMEHGR